MMLPMRAMLPPFDAFMLLDVTRDAVEMMPGLR